MRVSSRVKLVASLPALGGCAKLTSSSRPKWAIMPGVIVEPWYSGAPSRLRRARPMPTPTGGVERFMNAAKHAATRSLTDCASMYPSTSRNRAIAAAAAGISRTWPGRVDAR